MAAKKKPFVPKGKSPSDSHVYAAFISDLLAGDIKADELDEKRVGNGRLQFDYDDPNG